MVPRVGQRIGPYEILGRLGSGGMGLVFSAWDARLQRDVAIKLLRDEYATPTMRSRFLQEARAASGLNHPNICTVFDIGEVSGDPFMVMELLKGETLRGRISHKGALPPEDIHRIAAEVLDALSLAHARGVVHRDIKPANIILVNKPGGSFQCKVVDFGLAKVEFGDEEASRHDLTTIGTTVGTVSYMSPEQARGEVIDARSDLFSLGSVLYEAATGELPFQGATSALVFVELLGKNPPAMRLQNPAVPRNLERFINRLLAKSPADRFPSAAAALEAVRALPLHKSPLGGLSFWGGKGGPKPKPEHPASPGSPGPERSPILRSSESPAAPPGSSNGDSGTVLRPARRLPDPFPPRTPLSPAANFPGPASPYHVDRTPLPLEPPQATSRPTALQPGGVVVRPLKPDALRSSLPPSDAFAAGAPRSRAPSADLQEPVVGTGAPATSHDSLPPADSGLPTASGDAVALGAAASANDPARAGNAPKVGHSRRWLWIVPVLLLVVGILAWYFISHRETAESTEAITIVLAGMGNQTGDSSLNGVLATGLAFVTAPSPHLAVRSTQEYLLGLRAQGHAAGADVPLDQARAAARAVNAAVIVFGDIRGNGATYDLSLRLVNVATGNRIAAFTETASSREQIVDALDRLASDLRSALGETSDSIGRTAVPLSKEATSNLEALSAFSTGAGLEISGNPAEAILAYQHAVGLEPRFTQAQLRLADLYCEQHAEAASAHAADQAEASATNASARTQWLAEAGSLIFTARDYGAALQPIKRVLAMYPGDLDASNDLARAQLLAGKFSDAQLTASDVLQMSRYDPRATEIEELALIAQGRSEAVSGIEAQSRAVGRTHPDIAALADAATVASTVMLLPDAERPLAPAFAADLFDAAGNFNEGSGRWQALAGATPSAAAYAIGTAALHRALAGECPAALGLAQAAGNPPYGPVATFNLGEAQALCGNLDGARHALATLSAAFGQGMAAQSYLIPDLTATIAWKSGDLAGALRTLDAARQFDSMSLSPYLRGMVDIASHEPQLSIVQFQAILSHRGATTLFNPEIYPLAEFGLGRAYAASGDAENSSVAYGRFLELWSTADPGLAAIAEARSHAHL